MSRIRRPYPSDLSDEKWALLEPLLESAERRGRPPKRPARRVADAVYYHFGKWRRDGKLRRAHDRLREAVREAEGRDRNPSGAVIDS